MIDQPLTKHYESIYWRGTDLWPQLAGKSLFVAGGTGFYGSWFSTFLRYLRDTKGVPVQIESGVRQAGWDITRAETFTPFQRNADYLINCVGSSSAGLSEQDLLMQHVVGPVNLANHRAKTTAVMLQISSGAVSVGSKTPYALAKLQSEKHLYAMDLNRTLQVVRPFATIGPGMNLAGSFAISTFMRRTLAGQPLEVTSTPTQRSFCHITDLLVQCFHVMIVGDGLPYDVGSDHLITIEQAARLISDSVTVVDKAFPTNSDAQVCAADLTRIKSLDLGLDMDSNQAILDTWHYYRAQARPAATSSQ